MKIKLHNIHTDDTVEVEFISHSQAVVNGKGIPISPEKWNVKFPNGHREILTSFQGWHVQN